MNFFLRDNRSQKPNKVLKRYIWFLFSVVFLFYLIIYLSLSFDNVLAAPLSNRSITITDSRPSGTNVGYTFEWSGSTNTIRCIDILFCINQVGGCTTPTGFDSTGTSKGSWSGLTASSWNLDNDTNGALRLTYAAGEAPSSNVSLEFLGFINPSVAGNYNARFATFSDATCLNPEDWGPATFHIISGVGIRLTVPPPYATVIFKGKASPLAFLTILRNGIVAATSQASSPGSFQQTLTGLSGGNYTFSIFAKDRKARETPTLDFTVTLFAGTTTTISGIFLPPTVSLFPSKVGRGQIINISGETFPQSKINLFISPANIIKRTTANSQGRWSLKLDTSSLGLGEHSIKAKAISPQGQQSDFSKTLSFWVQCRGADLNFDRSVDIFDLSILLYFWGDPTPWNICTDINQDGKVNLVDFSIMMYQWTS